MKSPETLGTRGLVENRQILGALAILAACLCFAGNSLVVKLISARYDGWLISFVRFLVGAVLAALAIGLGKKSFKVRDKKAMFFRTLYGTSQMVLFFLGVTLTSSGRATLLMCTFPMFAALFGFLFFGERLGKTILLSLLLGFGGAFLVFYDGSSYSLFGNLVCLGAGLCNGIAIHFVKKSRESNSSFLVYLAPCLAGILVTGFAAPGMAGIANPTDAAILFSVGGLAFLGQVLITHGLSFLPATTGSLLGLSEVLFSIALSLAFVGEEMPPRFFLGASLILACLVVSAIFMNRPGKTTLK